MTEQALTERQLRERQYYEEYCRRGEIHDVDFSPANPNESRPWNPYWFVYQFVRERAGEGRRLLDFGCGIGEESILYTKMGYEVSGFDIAPSNVANARRLAARYEMQDRTNFVEMSAERLNYPSDHFDVIAGVDILHHVDIPKAISECVRVLKPGGVAIFREPVRAIGFDTLRNTRLGRWLVPNGASFERHVTEDERKLSSEDFAIIRGLGVTLEVRKFRLLSRLDKVFRTGKWLEKLDRALLGSLPFLRPLAGTAVLILTKK